MEPANVQDFFAVVMAPADQEWWWYFGQTGAQVGELLTQNKAMLTNISAYIDTDLSLKFASIMSAPVRSISGGTRWGEQYASTLTPLTSGKCHDTGGSQTS
jgi:hypothetical protein